MPTSKPNRRAAEALLANVRDLLDAEDPRSQVRAVDHLTAGFHRLREHVVLTAHQSGMTWAEIGRALGVSRQAAHERFAYETVLPAEFFDELMQDDDGSVVIEALARAAAKVLAEDKARVSTASNRSTRSATSTPGRRASTTGSTGQR